MNYPLAPSSIPAEARGLARDLLRRIEGETTVFAEFFRKTTAPLRARFTKLPDRPPRPEILATLARSWETTAPQVFRISFEAELRGVRGKITEHRFCIGNTLVEEWDSIEPGAAITRFVVQSTRHGIMIQSTPLVMISLHALARRYQRGRPVEAQIRDDLERLTTLELATDVKFGDRLSFAASHGGVWLGCALPDKREPPGRPLRFWIRTYMD